MKAGYYKDKCENVKVSLLISNLIPSVLNLPPSRITGLPFLSVNNRRLEPCNAFCAPARLWLAVIDFQNGERQSRSGSVKKRRNRLQ